MVKIHETFTVRGSLVDEGLPDPPKKGLENLRQKIQKNKQKTPDRTTHDKQENTLQGNTEFRIIFFIFKNKE